MGNPVVHFEMIGKDAPRRRAFYREAFGWQIGERAPGAGLSDYTLVRPEGATGIGGGIGAAPDEYSGHVTFYIGVRDVAHALDTIQQRGASKMMGPERVPDGPIIALFRDPEGHVVGLTQSATADA